MSRTMTAVLLGLRGGPFGGGGEAGDLLDRRRGWRGNADGVSQRRIDVGGYGQPNARRPGRQADLRRGTAGGTAQNRHPADHALPQRSYRRHGGTGEVDTHRHVLGPRRVGRDRPSTSGGSLQGLRRAERRQTKNSQSRGPHPAPWSPY